MIFADGDEFHLGRDDALARIPELRDGMAGAGAERLRALFSAWEMVEAIPRSALAGEFFVAAREVAVVLRLHFAAVVLGDVPSLAIHSARKARKAFARVAGELPGRPTGRCSRRRGPVR